LSGCRHVRRLRQDARRYGLGADREKGSVVAVRRCCYRCTAMTPPSGRKLRGAISIRLAADQVAYLEQRAEARGTTVSDELRECVDEAMIATVKQRQARQREVQRLIEAEDFEILSQMQADEEMDE
jgi:hypothetical protein